MLECSCCLRGFHLRCLQPPLKKVPEGDWMCPACDAGEPPPRPSKLVTHWQRLLYGDKELELAHIIGVTRGVCPKGVPE
jgi:origin recognition complex subunit 1